MSETTMATGTVLRASGGQYEVDVPGGEPWRCAIRGRLKRGGQEGAHPVTVGDRVRWFWSRS